MPINIDSIVDKSAASLKKNLIGGVKKENAVEAIKQAVMEVSGAFKREINQKDLQIYQATKAAEIKLKEKDLQIDTFTKTLEQERADFAEKLAGKDALISKKDEQISGFKEELNKKDSQINSLEKRVLSDRKNHTLLNQMLKSFQFKLISKTPDGKRSFARTNRNGAVMTKTINSDDKIDSIEIRLLNGLFRKTVYDTKSGKPIETTTNTNKISKYEYKTTEIQPSKSKSKKKTSAKKVLLQSGINKQRVKSESPEVSPAQTVIDIPREKPVISQAPAVINKPSNTLDIKNTSSISQPDKLSADELDSYMTFLQNKAKMNAVMDSDGLLIFENFGHPLHLAMDMKTIDTSPIFERNGINIARLFQHVKEITGNADLRWFGLNSLGELRKIGGDLDLSTGFREPNIDFSFGKLEEILGRRSEIAGLNILDFGNLKKISEYTCFGGCKLPALNAEAFREVGDLTINHSDVESLGVLRKAKMLFFSGSEIGDMGKLEEVETCFDFAFGKTKSFGNLKSIGTNAHFVRAEVDSFGNLEKIGGDVDIREAKIGDLGKLKYIGGKVIYDELTAPKLIKKFRDAGFGKQLITYRRYKGWE